jgi:PAS domain S-box-containing protein
MKVYERLIVRLKGRTLALAKASRPTGRAIEDDQQAQKALFEGTCRLQITFDQALAYAGALNEEIAERKRVEKELRGREALIRAALESTADGILVVNEEGDVTHRNRRFSEIFRMPEELADMRESRRVLSCLFNQIAEPRTQLSNIRMLGHEPEPGFETLHFKDGRVIQRFSFPLMRDGKAAGCVWSFRDVTGQELAERKHERREKLEGVLEMAGAVCHEVNQPLQVLSACAERMLDATPEDDHSYSQLEKIARSVETIAAITRKLQSIARYETKEYCSGIRIVDIDRASRLR